MKKLIVSLLTIALMATTFSGCTSAEASSETPSDQVTEASSTAIAETEEVGGNFTDEMKIPYEVDMSEWGADSVERQGDHQNSPYFNNLDFYNMESTDTLTILPNFRTQQQTTEWSCGVSAIVMALDHFDALGEHNEETLAKMRSNELAEEATSLKDVVAILETIEGYEVTSTYNFEGDAVYEYMTLDKIQELLKNNTPILMAWNDWGGHWQVIIGYDNMGTETYQDDVIIVADSYDTTDHNQDGYGVYPAERFYYNWTMYDFFTANYDIDERDMLFATLSPAA